LSNHQIFLSSQYYMPPRLKQVTVLYGENKLQTTFKIPDETSPRSAEEFGMKEIRQHLNTLEENGMPHIELDPDCTDFFPVPPPNIATVGELNGNITMVVWPAADPVTKFTPSPLLDAFVSTSSEVHELSAQKAVESLVNDPVDTSTDPQRKGKKKKAKQPEDAIMRRLSALEEEKTISDRKIAESDGKIAELKLKIAVLEADLRTIMSVVAGDRAALLLDLARDKLATLCRYQDWKDWKKNSINRDTMVALARAAVLSNVTVSKLWKDLAQHPTAFDFLVSQKSITLQGNLAAHKSEESVIAERIFSLPESSQERSLMTAIFTAYYGYPPVVEGLSPIENIH